MEFLKNLATVVAKGYEKKDLMNPTNEVILSNLPEILFTIFPTRCASSGEMLSPTLMNSLSLEDQDKSDVTMKSHSSNTSYSNHVKDYIGKHASVGLEHVLDTGKKYINKYIRRTMYKQKWAFMELLRALAYIFDPEREESISSICMKDGLAI